MKYKKTLISLLPLLLALMACSEDSPEVQWEIAIDGDVNQSVKYSFEDIAGLRRARITDILTRNPENPEEKTSWEGVTLFLLLQEPGGVEYSVDSWANILFADGTSRRYSLAELRGALIALKDAEGNWLADSGGAPVRLIAPNLPSSLWVDGPVRITIHAP
jgi:hypothetical protein